VFILFVVLGGVEGTSFAPEWVERSCLLYFFLGYFDRNGAFGCGENNLPLLYCSYTTVLYSDLCFEERGF